MKKFIWVSKHPLFSDQLKDLQRILGDDDVVVTRIHNDLDLNDPSKRAEISEQFNTADMIGVVMPIEVAGKLLDLVSDEIPIVRSKLTVEFTGKTKRFPDGSYRPERRWLHQSWERIVSVNITLKDL